ncbi:MAG TPA: hypothetical protein DCW68_00250 [Rhodospirillaceae bacterium]|nr:MAG: hypothetical protein A2018_01565 [Alphaproteobacteria bacterium GWF2_58_20]HAU28531.1 hypothetical protein [Rhodospirillaceae bacterium]
MRCMKWLLVFGMVALVSVGAGAEGLAQQKYRIRKNICNMMDDASCSHWVASHNEDEEGAATLAISAGGSDPLAMDVNGLGAADGVWTDGSSVTFEVTNTGTVASGSIVFQVENDAGANFVTDLVLTTCAASLDAAATCDIVLYPRADRNGSYDGTLRVSATTAGTASMAVAGVASGFAGGGGLPVAVLSMDPASAAGMDIAAAGMSVGLVLYGDVVPFTVRNCDGCETTTDLTINLSGTHFSMASNGCTAPLAGGGSCVIEVQPTADADVGSYTGMLTVSADAGGEVSAGLSGSANGFGPSDLYCWGHFAYGKVGHVYGDNNTVAVAVSAMGLGVDLAAGGYDHTCALKNGAVSCWGRNHQGQLGNNATTDSIPPVSVVDMDSDVTAVNAGFTHTCAIKSGVLYCWGGNAYGQLGDGTNINSLLPVEVQGDLAGGGVSVLSIGYYHSCAIKSGALYCWGENSFGKLGDNSLINRSTPTPVVGMDSGVTAVMVGIQDTCAVRSGAAYCWGRGYGGALGNGGTSDSHVPVAVLNMGSGVTSISTGLLNGCAIKSGALYCWGYNQYGLLGDGTIINRTSPVPVVDMDSGVTAVSAGDHHNCAIKDTTLYCWGRGETTGALGLGNYENRSVPTMVLGMDSGVTQLSNGTWHTCAIKP